MIRIQLVEKSTQDRRLACSDLACQRNESHTIVNAVKKVGKGFPMVPAEKDEPGVGGKAKRFFSETMKVEVHNLCNQKFVSKKTGRGEEI